MGDLDPDGDPGLDVDALIAAARPPEKTATLYPRGDLLGELDVLEEQLRAAELAAAVPEGMQMMNGPGSAAPALRRQVDAIRAQLEESALRVTVRAISNDELAALRAQAAEESSGATDPETAAADRLQELWVSAAAVKPRFSVAQVAALRPAVGEGQFQTLLSAAVAARRDEVSFGPFSPGASGTPSTPTS